MNRRRAGRRASRLGWAGQVAAWFVILGVVAVVAVAVAIPRLAGATPYTILTSSMEPTMPAGTLVVVRPVDIAEVSIGDVVTYQRESGKAAVVTHRVVAVGINTEGESVLTTQGDANESADVDAVLPVQVRGKQMYAVPHLGRVSSGLTANQRQIGVVVVAGLLLGYAGFMFASAARANLTKTGREESPA